MTQKINFKTCSLSLNDKQIKQTSLQTNKDQSKYDFIPNHCNFKQDYALAENKLKLSNIKAYCDTIIKDQCQFIDKIKMEQSNVQKFDTCSIINEQIKCSETFETNNLNELQAIHQKLIILRRFVRNGDFKTKKKLVAAENLLKKVIDSHKSQQIMQVLTNKKELQRILFTMLGSNLFRQMKQVQWN